MNEETIKVKSLFYLQYFFGTSCVSLKTVQQNWWKMVYSLFWLAVYILECLVYLQSVFTEERIDIPGFLKGIFNYLIVCHDCVIK